MQHCKASASFTAKRLKVLLAFNLAANLSTLPLLLVQVHRLEPLRQSRVRMVVHGVEPIVVGGREVVHMELDERFGKVVFLVQLDSKLV